MGSYISTEVIAGVINDREILRFIQAFGEGGTNNFPNILGGHDQLNSVSSPEISSRAGDKPGGSDQGFSCISSSIASPGAL